MTQLIMLRRTALTAAAAATAFLCIAASCLTSC